MNPIKNTIGMLGIGYAKKEIMAHFRRDHRCSFLVFSFGSHPIQLLAQTKSSISSSAQNTTGLPPGSVRLATCIGAAFCQQQPTGHRESTANWCSTKVIA